MKTTLHFSESDRSFKLKNAILIYGGDDNSDCAATIHAISPCNGRPVITPGEPVTIGALERLILGLGKQSGANFIPDRVVSLGMSRMAWWCPPGRRRIWFKLDSRFEEKKDKAAKLLQTVNGKFVHHPPLLFVANNGLSVYALPENKRPTLRTRLFKAPYWNLNSGHMCNGNLKLPDATTDSLEAFEQAFFNSAFTHGNDGVLTRHPGGHHGLWAELAQRKTAPDMNWWKRQLVKTDKTMNSLFQ